MARFIYRGLPEEFSEAEEGIARVQRKRVLRVHLKRQIEEQCGRRQALVRRLLPAEMGVDLAQDVRHVVGRVLDQPLPEGFRGAVLVALLRPNAVYSVPVIGPAAGTYTR